MSTSYDKKALRTTGLIAYWPMNEESGTVFYDLGPNGFNGTSSGLTRLPASRSFLGPDGSKCAVFTSSKTSRIDLIGAAGSSKTDGSWGKGSQTTGSIGVWVAIPKDNLKGTTRMDICRFAADDNNEIEIYFDTTAYRFAMLFNGGGTGVTNNSSLAYNMMGPQRPQWHHLCMTYSTGVMLTYLDGDVETDTADTTSSAWSGNYASALMNVGVTSTTATTSSFFNGYMKGFLWSGAILSPAEVKDLAKAGP